MTWEASEAVVWAVGFPTPSHKLVASILAERADRQGWTCHPFHDEISAKAELSKDRVGRIMADLIRLGVVEEVEKAHQHYAATYRLCRDTLDAMRLRPVARADSERVPDSLPAPTLQGVRPVAHADSGGGSADAQGRCTDRPDPVHTPTYTVKNQKKEPVSRRSSGNRRSASSPLPGARESDGMGEGDGHSPDEELEKTVPVITKEETAAGWPDDFIRTPKALEAVEV